MKYIITIFLLALILSGCGSTNENRKIQELEEQISELTSQKETDFFNKNKECSEYKEQVKDEILSEPFVMEIDLVFYSPKQNSCLYVLWKQQFREGISKYEQQFFLIDLFTNELITGYYSEIKSGKTKEEFDQIVEDYKK